MAYYAKLGPDNIVLRVDAVDNEICTTPDGDESDELAINHLIQVSGEDGTWIKCSYNTRLGKRCDEFGRPTEEPGLRANWPGGKCDPENGNVWYYNEEHDIFHRIKPSNCDSWTLNTTTGDWEPPYPCPEVTREQVESNISYVWSEESYQLDNNNGWILTSPESSVE